jgi:hypothetical protein
VKRRFSTKQRLVTLVLAAAAVSASLGIATPALAETTVPYQAVYVEPVGGPNQSPFGCPPGTSCGSANISGIGHSESQMIVFNTCGLGCHTRTITFDDGSTLVIREEAQGEFTSPGSSGANGYNGFEASGNPRFLDITDTIVGGTGQFAGATGGGTGTVKLAGGVATIKVSGTITLR